MKTNVLEQVNQFQREIGLARAPKNATAKVTTVSETAGHRVLLVDLTNVAAGTKVPITVEGYAVQVAKAGSDAMAVQLDLGAAGRFGPVYPGVVVRPRQQFRQIVVQRWTSSVSPPAGALTQAGCDALGRFLTLVVSKTPDAEYSDAAAGTRGGFIHCRQSATQAYGSTANIPTSINDGVRVDGARAVRCYVFIGGGATILTGTVVWWWTQPGTQAWGETDVQQALTVGRSSCSPPELETTFGSGRLFPEIRNLTTSAGSGSPEVAIYSVGEGGELNVGDIA